MINLDDRYHSYLNSKSKFLVIDGKQETVVGYGWTDDGSSINGYYVTTENFTLYYNMKENFSHMEPR
jgi:hypothetical protein|tara:strand:+ start:245 stop:445 length:201 start_codon:yes stop_codon:yes gene_type:complete